MRLGNQVVTDHDKFTGIDEDDHHNRGDSDRVLVNSHAIAGTTAYELRISLGKSGYKTLRATLRGHRSVGVIGNTGAFVLASDVSQECSSFATSYSGYTYMGCHSRIHGDTVLSWYEFGPNIHLRDCYIDDDEAVFEFYNAWATSRNLTVYGTFSVK